MAETAIRVDGLSKVYRIGARQELDYSLRSAAVDYFKSRARRLTGKSLLEDAEDTIWALKDVSFQVDRGEVLGIIGRNGAGKTTLLKILSRITEPTKGRVELRGRVASLLEVGTGFHPELTGRENIFLNGAVLGMSRAEIKKKFDEIVEFAEVEKFLDTPVKRYSDGMRVRLAFAVAAHLQPEILLVDEVLAVGDAAFQKKCLNKVSQISRAGRTVLQVSHNMTAIRSFSNRAFILQHGIIDFIGDVHKCVDKYLATSVEKRHRIMDTSNIYRPENHGEKIRVERVEMKCFGNDASIPLGSPLELKINIAVRKPVEQVAIGLGVFSKDNIKILGSNSAIDRGVFEKLDVGNYLVKARMDPLLLAPGEYFLDMDVRSANERLDYLRTFYAFRILDNRNYDTNWYRTQEGFILSNYQWQLSFLGASCS